MLVTVNNDVHNIPVLENKETVVKLKNSFELSMNVERLLKTRNHGRTLCVSPVVGRVTESRNKIYLMFVDKVKSLFKTMLQLQGTSSKSKYI